MRDPWPAPPHSVLTLITPIAHFLGLTTLPNHFHEIICAYLFYNAVYLIAAPLLSKRFAPNTYLSLSRRTRLDWDVRVVSEVQSILILCLAFFLVYADEQRVGTDWKERLWGYNGATGMVQAFAAGYFLWDVQVSSMHLEVEGLGSLVHAVGALAVTCLGFRPFANYYGVNFILYEISTPFLNIHWFLDKFGMTGTTAQLINGILLIITFGCSRLIWGTYQSALIYHDLWTAWNNNSLAKGANSGTLTKNDAGNALPGSDYDVLLPLWLALLYLGSNTVLSVLNFYWFSRMIAAMRKRFEPSQVANGTVEKRKRR